MEKKTFLQRVPFLDSLLIAFVVTVSFALLSSVINFAVSLVVSGYPSNNYGIVGLLCAAVVVIGFYHWMHKDFKGFLNGGNMTLGFKLCVPFLIYIAVSHICSVIVGEPMNFGGITFKVITTSLYAGISEEIVFRGYVIPGLMKDRLNASDYRPVVIISAVVFGLFHALNIFAGANVLRTLLQVVEAGLIGVYFAVVYIRSGNLLPLMLLHAFNDILAIGFAPDVAETGVIQGGLNAMSFIDLGLCIVIAIVGLKLLNDAEVSDIRQLWADLWHR